MIQWTDSARQRFDQYCARVRQSLAGSGADADEVIEDLRRHIDEEVRATDLCIVTDEDLQRILARVGDPAIMSEPASTPKLSLPPDQKLKPDKPRPGFLLLFMGVILPLFTLGFELVTGMSAGIICDPFPTWIHIVLVALVPVINLWMWRASRARRFQHANLLGWLNGVALAVCCYYSVIYLPFSPIAAIGVIYFGLGLIPLAPYLALLATPVIRLVYQAESGWKKIPGWKRGFAAGLVLMVMLQLPSYLTYRGLARAVSEDPAESRAGVRLLRACGDRELMLRACYGMLDREANMDLVQRMAGYERRFSSEAVRAIYYRVTGQPFNAVPPPTFYARQGRWSPIRRELRWDDALGGETVAGRVTGLSLKSSRLDAIVEPDDALAYCEWTLEFHNVFTEAREARAQIALPPGGVVSRLTLWVNGEEREAAFAGRGEVRKAYQQVAVVRRRDPVLVTTCGPDRVLMQCFPVPPNGGTMKVRLGITVPLVLDSLDKARFSWPKFLERNFGLSDELKHNAWIDSPQPLNSENSAFKTEHPKEKVFTLHGSLTEKQLAENANAIVVTRRPEIMEAWTRSSDGKQVIRQTIVEAKRAPPARIVVVIDGSAGMDAHSAKVASALAKLPESAEVSVMVASDEPVLLNEKPQKPTAEFFNTIQKKIRSMSFAGGCDNLPALEKAWDLAAESGDGTIFWIHAAQPFLVSSVDALRQRIERASQSIPLIGFPVTAGPNRIAEALDGLPQMTFAPRFGSVESDLSWELSWLDGKTRHFRQSREQMAEPTGGLAGKPASRHLERLWARDEAVRLTASRQRDAATEIAAKNQLVTPVTGAVVLETKQQYEENNLKPADPQTVPTIPEPQSMTLFLLGAVLLFGRRLFSKNLRKDS